MVGNELGRQRRVLVGLYLLERLFRLQLGDKLEGGEPGDCGDGKGSLQWSKERVGKGQISTVPVAVQTQKRSV